MANLSNVFGGAFDASGVDPQAPIEIIPAGKYLAQIVASEMKQTKDQSGEYLALTFGIIDGEYDGRKVFDNLNLVNANPKTSQIAQSQLSAICHAIGKLNIEDSEQLHFQTMEITVSVELDKRDEGLPVEERRRQNRIKGYAPANPNGAQPANAPPRAQGGGGAAAAPRAATPPARTAAAASAPAQAARPAGQAAPWRR